MKKNRFSLKDILLEGWKDPNVPLYVKMYMVTLIFFELSIIFGVGLLMMEI